MLPPYPPGSQRKQRAGETVTYAYDNCGNLATVTDSETGIVTTYYYDLLNRQSGYREKGTGLNHIVTYAYDGNNNLASMTETLKGVTKTYTYTYDEDNRLISESIGEPVVSEPPENNINITYSYDGFGRLETRTVKQGDTVIQTTSPTYSAGNAENSTTGQISSYNGYTYTYDDNGNILTISDGTNTTSYEYDSANQLVRENNQEQGFTHTWTYDNAGNIQNRKEYAYTTGELGEPTKTVSYGYIDEEWGDLLTSYNGKTITYDDIGNPETYDGWTYTWKHGRELVSMSDGTTTWTFTYGADGMRTKRTNSTDTYTYVYNGSYLTVMTKGDDTLQFTYDASGTPLAVIYNGVTYYYHTNLQGDILGIKDSTGSIVVTYAYDAWGKLLSTTGTMADSLGTVNPLRYRGYVYDSETALYYLQSRYYNPEWGRFINADAFVATGQGLLGNNMFAYCLNNPINFIDPFGNFPFWFLFCKSNAASSVNESRVIEGLGGTSSAATTIANVATAKKALPRKGEPNSSQTLHNPDGTLKQRRWYGPNGDAIRDRDYNHAGELPFPHDHEWKDGEKQPDHLPPSPDYEFSGDVILGVGITVVCIVGIGWVALNDISGVGTLDDASLIPLSENLTRGINMIFKGW